jgi:methyl-accepting chemotaxis protein
MITGSIKTKMIFVFLVIALVPSIVLGVVTYLSSRSALMHQITEDFDAIAAGKEEAVTQYLIGAKRALGVHSHAETILNALAQINDRAADSSQAVVKLRDYLETRLKMNPLVQEFFVIDRQGKVVASTEEKEIGLDKSQDPYFVGARENDFFIKDVYQSKTTGKIGFVASEAIKDLATGEFLGVFAERLNLQSLNEILGNRMGLGESGESYIVNKEGLMVTESRFEKDATLNRKIDTAVLREFRSTGKDAAGVYADYRGSVVLGAVSGETLKRNFEFLGWAVVAEIDTGEAFAPVKKLGALISLMVMVTVMVVVVVALIVANNITNPIKNLADVAAEISKGNLTGSISVKSGDEVGVLAKSFGDMLVNLRTLLVKIQESTNHITSASNEILAATQEQASAAREQSSAVAETTSAAKELSATSEQVGESIKKVSQVATHAMAGMAKIKEVIAKTNDMLTSLGEKSQKIGKITELIDDVADQTNLLAVNASIEAARAGEQGRGFTVVADEIRKLADSTAKSTKDITALIELIQHEMSNAIMSMEQSVTSVDEEARLAQQTTEKTKEIAMSTHQQISGSKQIADAMMSIDEAMKQIAAGAAQSQASVKQLNELAGEMKQLTSKFKL